MTEDEMVVWHYHLDGHEFEQAPADGEGLGSLGFPGTKGGAKGEILVKGSKLPDRR